MQATWVRSLAQKCALEKEMATHSSTVAWKMPWTEEPCRLQSMGSQKSQTRLSDFTSLHFTSLQGLLMKGSYVCKEQHKLIALLLQFPGEKSVTTILQ